jgi:DNA polymerase phi
MAEMKSPTKAEPATPAEAAQSDRHSLLEHSREFLDFFWDIAKPDQETRLRATEKLLEYLRTRPNV